MAANNPNVSAGRSTAQNRQRTLDISQAVLTGQMTQPDRAIDFLKTEKFQFPSDLPKEFIRLSIENFTNGLGFGGLPRFGPSVGGGTSAVIILPMPKQLLDQHSVGYKQEAIGAVTGNLTNAVTGNDTTGSIVSAAQAGLAQAAGAFTASLTGLNSFEAFQAQTGQAPNQFLTVMLTGPQFKKHELSWTLSPRNKRESEMIRKIIRELYNSMAVKFTPGDIFFQHPQVVTPSFTNANVLYKFKPCVIENMTVNYAPSGAPSFYAGTAAPDSVELRLSLLEIEFWFSGDFKSTPIA